MTQITVSPADSHSWPAVERALTGGGDGSSCWCQWFRLTAREFEGSSREERRSALRQEVEEGERPPGLLAHVDGKVAGWCRVAPRVEQPRLNRSRIVRQGSSHPSADEGVWAVTCFVVRREFRRHGVARALALAAVDFARDQGATGVEAYPVDTTARPQMRDNELFHGDIGLFRAAGFVEVTHPSPGRAVMELDLTGARRAADT